MIRNSFSTLPIVSAGTPAGERPRRPPRRGDRRTRANAPRICAAAKEAMARQPTGFGRMLGALHTLVSPSQEIAIVGPADDPATQALLDEARKRYLPNTVLAFKQPGEASILPVLESRELVDGKPAAYVCEHYACQLPVTSPEALAKLLG